MKTCGAEDLKWLHLRWHPQPSYISHKIELFQSFFIVKMVKNHEKLVKPHPFSTHLLSRSGSDDKIEFVLFLLILIIGMSHHMSHC